ncbi:MAG: ATP-grasp domain-containing protein [Oscillospiraceae bacterium]|nr:ATP-grasp domain-containing protein [Oscillospiraceae bacterium]
MQNFSKKLLIIGASVLQLPAILKAKEMGLYVAVADYNPNAVGIAYADEFFNVSTIDEKGICEAAKQFKADGVMTLATDMPMRAVAYTCEKLGLTGISYDTAIKATDKGEMIKAFEKAGVAHPWYFTLTSPDMLAGVADQVTYPCISKPVDNAGSRGVMLINNQNELEEAVNYSSANGRKGGVIIEEYLRGSEVSVEVMVIAGDVHILQVTDKLTTGAPHFVEMGHSQPSRLGEDNVNAIKALAEKAVKAIGIQNGPAHVEIMLTEQGPKMIELGARMGGDCITTHLVPLSTGVDMVKATIETALGGVPDIRQKQEKGSAIRFFSPEHGVIARIEGLEAAKSIPGVREITLTKNVGDTVGEIGSSGDRAGFVVAQADTAEKAVEVCEKVLLTVNIVVE